MVVLYCLFFSLSILSKAFKEGEALIIDVLVLPDVFPTFEEEGFVCVLDLVVVLPVVAEDGISFVNSFNDLDDIECLIWIEFLTFLTWFLELLIEVGAE